MTHTLLWQWAEQTRRSRGQTVSEVCAELGVSETTWRRLRTRRHWMRTEAKCAFSEYLGVSHGTLELLWSSPGDPDYDATSMHAAPPESRLGQEIDRARGSQSDDDLGDELGVSGTTVARYRTLGVSGREYVWQSIARFLNVSVQQTTAWAEEPAAPEPVYPQPTWIGIKYHPTVTLTERVNCERCRFVSPCRTEVVEREGFAWCEALHPVDMMELSELLEVSS